MRRLVPVLLVLATAGGLASSAQAAGSYKTCNNPKTSYVVVRAHGVSCRTAKSVGRSFERRSDDQGEGFRSVRGWRVGKSSQGTYLGLEGTRTRLTKGKARILYYSRGE